MQGFFKMTIADCIIRTDLVNQFEDSDSYQSIILYSLPVKMFSSVDTP